MKYKNRSRMKLVKKTVGGGLNGRPGMRQDLSNIKYK